MRWKLSMFAVRSVRVILFALDATRHISTARRQHRASLGPSLFLSRQRRQRANLWRGGPQRGSIRVALSCPRGAVRDGARGRAVRAAARTRRGVEENVMTTTTEIAPDVFRISTYAADADL